MTSAGDSAASDGWQRVARDLRAFVRRRVHDEHTAEDLVQDVFAKLAHEVANRGEPVHLVAWLFRCLRHAIVDHYRGRRSAAAVPLPEAIADSHVVPPGAAEQEQLLTSCRAFVQSLPPKYHEAVLLTDYEGMSQVELAERLGIPVATAKSRVQRGRAKLRQALTECCTFEMDRRGGVIGWQRRSAGKPCC